MLRDVAVSYGDYFELPNPSLKAYFGHVRSGNDKEYRTTFFAGKSLQEVLDGWSPQLSVIGDAWPTLLEYELNLAKKVGPMSIMKPLSQRMADIDSYYEAILRPQTPISRSAIAAVLLEWNKVRGFVQYDQNLTVELMRKSTNSGSPYFTKRRDVLSRTVPCSSLIIGDDVIIKQGNESWKAAAVLGWRGQEGGPNPEDVKQRVVWMFPFALNVLELQVYQPLIELAQRHNLVPAWVSMESVDRRITNLFDTKGPDDVVICTDFSKFDQHFNASCQVAAKAILAELLSRGTSKSWLESVFPIKYMIPLSYDYGRIRFGPHGMGSGSGGTNADETLVHRALQYEAAQSANAKLNLNSMCLGDDGVLSYPGCTVDQVVRSYTAHGLDMNATKQYVSKDDCEYLRRWHHKDYRMDGICVGVYSTNRALGRLCEQERFYSNWSAKMVALRQLSILENVKYHPLATRFADYCMQGDVYRLGIDIPGFLDNLDKEVEEAIEHIPDFLGYVRSNLSETPISGISQWWIVRYLKSKR